jgi:hypothetical protein
VTQDQFAAALLARLPAFSDPRDEEAIRADLPRLWREGYPLGRAEAYLRTFEEVDPSRGEEEALAERGRIETLHRLAGLPRRG